MGKVRRESGVLFLGILAARLEQDTFYFWINSVWFIGASYLVSLENDFKYL